ncbi:acylneuraminate cytidylyltransferase family protein [Lachnospiraceae bacterium 29-84]
MINGKRVLALIPARGGSKGIPKKNVIDLCGRPLISYSIKAGRQSRYVDDVVVTTDSEEIAEVSKAYGADVPFLRPGELASDTAKTIDAVLHAIDSLRIRNREYDILALLQPTQPLRRAKDIDRALETYMDHGMQDVVSVKKVQEHPVLMRTIAQKGKLENLLKRNSTVRRQDMPVYYLVDGSIYINAINRLSQQTGFNDNPIPFIMDAERSVDIDGWRDLERAEYLLNKENF